MDLDIKGSGFTFDGNKLTTDWDENSKVEKRENGIYLYDIAGGLDNWTIVSYMGSNGIKTNDEVVQYIYAFSRYPVDEENRNPQSMKFLTEFEKSTNDVMNEINWLHNNGYPQRAQWFPKERDLMIFKGVGVPLDIHELYGDLVNKTCEDGLRYPDSVCEALFVIERVEYTDSDSNKLPILDMDIRCLWSSENCNVKPGELLPKDERTSYTGTKPDSRTPGEVIGNYYAFDFKEAYFPPYKAAKGYLTKKDIMEQQGYMQVQDTQYTQNSNGSVSATTTAAYIYTGNKSWIAKDTFYWLFYGEKKTTYESAGYSFGKRINRKDADWTLAKYEVGYAVDYDVKTDLVTFMSGESYPLWYLRRLGYHQPVEGDLCYVLFPDHYDETGMPCYNDGTPFYKTFDPNTTVQAGGPILGDPFKCKSITAGIATIEPWKFATNDGFGYTFTIDVRCLAKANHYAYGPRADTEIDTEIHSIGNSFDRLFYPCLVTIKPGASVEYAGCGSCIDPDHIWEFTPGTNPYGTQPMLVIRTFDKLNKALVTPATIKKLQYASGDKPDYSIEYGGLYDKQTYAIAVSLDDLEVITKSYEGYATSTQSQTSTLPISSQTYSDYSTGNSYYGVSGGYSKRDHK